MLWTSRGWLTAEPLESVLNAVNSLRNWNYTSESCPQSETVDEVPDRFRRLQDLCIFATVFQRWNAPLQFSTRVFGSSERALSTPIGRAFREVPLMFLGHILAVTNEDHALLAWATHIVSVLLDPLLASSFGAQPYPFNGHPFTEKRKG